MINFCFKISNGARLILDRLHENGYGAYVVGGSVRNMMLGISVDDFDITTSALPSETKSLFPDFTVVETGIKHGTVTVVVNGENVEITTYRTEGEYTDSRHPDKVEFTSSLELDLSRRDFTVNALAYDGEGTVVDLFGGEEDIKNKLIRAIGNPYERFNEDALRILRAVRFSSVLGFDIHAETRQAMLECKHLLHRISKERIAVEINKFLCGKNVKNALIDNWQILAEIIPEIGKMKGFDQKNRHHIYDILTHTAVVIENTLPIPHIRLAALMHDTGKIYTVSVDGNGEQHFYAHPHKSEEIARRYLNEYRYDNFTKDRVCLLVKIHDTVVEENKVYIKKRLNRIGKDAFFELINLQRADNKAQNPAYDRTEHFDAVVSIADRVLSEAECFSLKSLEINGNDLMTLGFEKGRVIGEILDYLLKEVMEERLENNKECLLKASKDRFGG